MISVGTSLFLIGLKFTKIYIIDAGSRDIHRRSIQASPYPHRETEAFCSPWDSDVQR